MSQVKYIPAEIDGVNIMEPIERLLVDSDVAVNSPGLLGPNVETALLQLQNEILGITVGATNWDLALTNFNWDVLMDQNGNVLAKGF